MTKPEQSGALALLLRPLSLLGGLGALMLVATAALASEPESAPAEKAIVLGMSSAFTGSADQLGLDMRAGVEAALAEVNRAGGIKGRPLRLVALDDGYEPSRTVPNMKQLLEKEHAVAIIGNVGTPTAVVALPIAQHAGAAFVGAFSGGGVLRRNPPDPVVFNFRASYAEETSAMVSAIVDQLHIAPDEVAFFTQRDAFGDSGYNGGVTALRARGLKSEAAIAHGRYDRNSCAVDGAVAEMLGASKRPKAIIMVGTAEATAAFVRLARQSGLRSQMVSISFVGAAQLAARLGKHAEGVIVGRVVPLPDPALPIIREFFAAVPNNLRTRDVALEGYIAGRMLCRALATIEGEPTRPRVLAALESLGTFDLGLGVPLKLSPTEHQACHKVWATRLHEGSIEPIEWSALGTPQATAQVEEAH